MTDTIRVVVPLTIRRRNGRPKILPPDNMSQHDTKVQDSHVLRAIARGWSWRRKLEVGTVSTIQDIATAEKVSDRFVSRMARLAYLSPDVLEQLVLGRRPPALSMIGLGRERPGFAAIAGPNFRNHRLTVSWETSTPRSVSISSISR